MRPGAPFAPIAVWQLAQLVSAALRAVTIGIVTPLRVTSARYGNATALPGHSAKKFPLALVVSSWRTPSLPVIATVTAPTPAQFVSSWAAAITVPANV